METKTTSVAKTYRQTSKSSTITLSYMDICRENRLPFKAESDDAYIAEMVSLGLKKQKLSKKEIERLTKDGFPESAGYAYIRVVSQKDTDQETAEKDEYQVSADLSEMQQDLATATTITSITSTATRPSISSDTHTNSTSTTQ